MAILIFSRIIVFFYVADIFDGFVWLPRTREFLCLFYDAVLLVPTIITCKYFKYTSEILIAAAAITDHPLVGFKVFC